MGVSSVKSGRFSRVFTESLASAVLEWLLLFLLFTNAVIAYLVTRFVRCCGLQTPCLLCSRLDHVMGNERSGYYWDMICGSHKLEISALAICHAHSNLGHVHDAMKIIGSGCFDHVMNRVSLPHVGYMELKDTSDTESEAMFSDVDGTGVLVSGPKEHVSVDFATMEPPSVLVSNEQTDSARDCNVENVEYGIEIGLKEMNWVSSELKHESSFDDELLFFDDFQSSENEVVAQEEPSSETYAAEANESAETDVAEPDVTENVETDPIPTPEKPTKEKAVPSETSREVPSTLDVAESDVIENAETGPIPTPEKPTEEKVVSTESSQEEKSSTIDDRESTQESDSESPKGDPSNGSSPRVSFHDSREVPSTLDVSEFEVIENVETDPIPTAKKPTEEKIASTETSLEEKSSTIDDRGSTQESVSEPLNRDPLNGSSPRVCFHDSREVPSTLEDRGSQESDSESPSQDLVRGSSPRVSFHDPVMNESSPNVVEFTMIPNSIERNESDRPMDGEMESEALDRLNRQIEDDKQALNELQQELEEERNAAAVAANEAMAMITRLQDEKANLHMEAQQYLRVMEEQAEYDMEALQKSNDLLVEREMEIQDLEEELESYRINELSLPENINDSLLCIEDERIHLQTCLKKLEEKIRVRVSSNPNLANGDEGERQSDSNSPDKDSFPGSKGVDVDSLAKEVSDLQERLEALETDSRFLEHTIKYLRIGDEGLLFIQDLASHLQEIRTNRL